MQPGETTMQDTVQAGAPTAPPPEQPTQAPVRVLTRSRDRMLGGVAAGLAEYFDLDPTIVRLGLVLTALLSGGIVLVAYIALWIIMPEPPAVQMLGAPSQASPGAQPPSTAPARGGNGALILGVILVGVGGFALLSQFPMFHMIGWGLARIWWPTMLILVGMALILARSRD